MMTIRPILQAALLAGIALAASAPSARAGVDANVSGSFNTAVDINDIPAGAGADFAPLVSAGDAVQINVAGFGPAGATAPWQISVSMTSTNWPSDAALLVQRTGDGKPAANGGSISGGMAYQPVSTVDALFFSGTGDNGGHIPIQVQTQMHLTEPALKYTAKLVFTIVAL